MLCVSHTGSATPSEVAEAMERRQLLTEELQENEAATERYRADIAANEAARKEIQAKIDKSAIDTNNNANFLKILSTFRIQVGQSVVLMQGCNHGMLAVFVVLVACDADRLELLRGYKFLTAAW